MRFKGQDIDGLIPADKLVAIPRKRVVRYADGKIAIPKELDCAILMAAPGTELEQLFGCDVCDRNYIEWFADDSDWRKLPGALRDKRLCVACFIAKRKP